MRRNMELDVDVIKCFRKGCKTAFGTIYNHYYKAIKTNISKLILDNDIAEDILQDVFFKFWENKPPLKDAHELSAWLFRVSYNTSITYIRDKLRNKKYILSEIQVPTHNSPANEEAVKIGHLKEGHLDEAIKLLPHRKRQVVDLCKFQGKSYAEAGSLLGIEKDTVKEYLTASMKFIKHYILSKDIS